MGFALGLLYRHLSVSMVESRKQRKGCPGGYPEYQQVTEALFLRVSLIRLTRRAGFALHRELVGRVLLERR